MALDSPPLEDPEGEALRRLGIRPYTPGVGLAKNPVFGPLVNAVEFAAFHAARLALAVLPEGLARAAGRTAGRAMWTLMPSRSRQAAENARRALGEDGPAVAKRSFSHFGEIAVEMARARRTYTPEGWRDRVEFQGLENIDAALAMKKGVLIVGAHLGNWEIAGWMTALIGYPVNTVTQKQRNPHVHAWLERWRRSTGQRTIPKDGALREAIRALRRNELVAMLTDQDARKEGIWVEFLGASASTHRAPGLLSVRQGVPIVTFAAPRIEPRRYRIAFDPPFVAEATGDSEEDVRRVTARIAASLEAHIRRWPDQWLWAHRRWKTRPRKEAAAPA